MGRIKEKRMIAQKLTAEGWAMRPKWAQLQPLLFLKKHKGSLRKILTCQFRLISTSLPCPFYQILGIKSQKKIKKKKKKKKGKNRRIIIRTPQNIINDPGYEYKYNFQLLNHASLMVSTKSLKDSV